MTENDAVEFVTTEIKARYRTLNDVQFGDWVSVAMKAPDYARARAVVREIVGDPGATLSIKAFVTRLGIGKRGHQGRPLPPTYDPYVLCLEAPAAHPDWAGRQWVTFEGGFRRSDAANRDYVTQFAHEAAMAVQQREGGEWCGHVEPVNNDWPQQRDPQARQKAERHILTGPDSPGRRWLLRQRAAKGERQQFAAALAQSLPAAPVVENKPRVATRAELDAFVDRLKEAPHEPMEGPQVIDWGSDDLDVVPGRTREPGEEG